jgi:hypothetical protein
MAIVMAIIWFLAAFFKVAFLHLLATHVLISKSTIPIASSTVYPPLFLKWLAGFCRPDKPMLGFALLYPAYVLL